MPPAPMAICVQRPSFQWGPGLSGATALNALVSQTKVAKPPDAGPQGTMRLAAAHVPWYFALLASDLAALRGSPLSLTSWRIKTSVSEDKTPASVPVDQEVTLAVMSERASDLEVGVEWGRAWRHSSSCLAPKPSATMAKVPLVRGGPLEGSWAAGQTPGTPEPPLESMGMSSRGAQCHPQLGLGRRGWRGSGSRKPWWGTTPHAQPGYAAAPKAGDWAGRQNPR